MRLKPFHEALVKFYDFLLILQSASKTLSYERNGHCNPLTQQLDGENDHAHLRLL